MIKLTNVSKFYYNKGIIASGFNKINLEFNIGEFVAITGESGSGKSTLLNVLSGLDSYEEGEMYINGQETSHYTEKDFEDYRRKYIGNIFQNFNLVNSYTVYQNIELVLLLNGEKKKNVKTKVLYLIKQVDLYKFRNTKVSRLSGGQKQRVAIARCLAKDTPIIIADEPTGNLDSKSATEIIKILSNISKNKLVIIVTHNYEQVEKYVTRKIKMHDGKVLEDKVIKPINNMKNIDITDYKNIAFLNKIKLGIRNTFNIIPKFILIFLVYLFITISLLAEYSSFKKQEYMINNEGSNNFFMNTSDKRIVVKKNDKTAFTEEDFNNINKLDNVSYIIKNDLLLDNIFSITDNNELWINSEFYSIKEFKSKLDYGRLPKDDNEIILYLNKNDYSFNNIKNSILTKSFFVQNPITGENIDNLKLTVVGIKYLSKDDTKGISKTYTSDSVLDRLSYELKKQYSSTKVLFLDIYHESNDYDNKYKININNNVPIGSVYISSDLNYLCKNENCINYPLSILSNTLYYKNNVDLKVKKTYDKSNIKTLLNINEFDDYNGQIFINANDYNKLFNNETYQISIFVKNPKIISNTINDLNKLNYNTLKISDTLVSSDSVQIIRIFKTIVTIMLVVVLFFITYLVVKIILKSRNIYFSTIRMLGATKKISKELLIIELLNVSNLAFFGFIIFLYLNKLKLLNYSFVNNMIYFLDFKDYLILYIILLLMSYLLSQKYASSLFKSSAIKTLKEEI